MITITTFTITIVIIITGAHNPERATPTLGHAHFRALFPAKIDLHHHHVCERNQSIRYQKGKLNLIKRQKKHF